MSVPSPRFAALLALAVLTGCGDARTADGGPAGADGGPARDSGGRFDGALPDAGVPAPDAAATADGGPVVRFDAGPDCVPRTCFELGADCGDIGDGCGGVQSCGECGDPFTCGAIVDNRCGCVPRTCGEQGIFCGEATDGCGTPILCGFCVEPLTCGGGGVDGVCGCTPASCEDLGFDCGDVTGSCGGPLSCGTCSGFDTCGGGGEPNVCGCTPRGCGFRSCGTVDDGCGAPIDCGGCGAGAGTCGGGGSAGVCGCATTSTAGPRAPRAAENRDAGGGRDWLTTERVFYADGEVTRVNLSGSTPASSWLVVTDFGFTLPSVARVNGVEVEVLRAGGGSSIADAAVRLVNRGAILGEDRASATRWFGAGTVTYGGADDLWGHDWTPTDVSHPGFGVAIALRWVGSAGNEYAEIDRIRITVRYADACP